jgi:hypothetical protein
VANCRMGKDRLPPAVALLHMAQDPARESRIEAYKCVTACRRRKATKDCEMHWRTDRPGDDSWGVGTEGHRRVRGPVAPLETWPSIFASRASFTHAPTTGRVVTLPPLELRRQQQSSLRALERGVFLC